MKTSFTNILDELRRLEARKRADYGSKADPLANIRASRDFGVEPWIAALVRANDKMRRLMRYAQTGRLSNEGAEDSLKDLAVYAIIALVLLRRERRPKAKRRRS